MNWDALGAIAELLGAIAVFLTLAYLTIQFDKIQLPRFTKSVLCGANHASQTDTVMAVEQSIERRTAGG